MTCSCPRPLDITEITMQCTNWQSHMREIVAERVESWMLEQLENDDGTAEDAILYGVKKLESL